MTLPPEIARVLLPEEKVFWIGRPYAHVFAERGLMSLLYGVTWAVLGSFWYYGSGGIGEGSAFEGWWRLMPLGSVPFILVGLSLFYYPWQLARQANRTWYVVTAQRAFIVEISGKNPLRVFRAEEVAPPEDRLRWDRLHSLVLTRRMQDAPHLPLLLDAGFLGLSATNAQAALTALRELPMFSPVAE